MAEKSILWDLGLFALGIFFWLREKDIGATKRQSNVIDFLKYKELKR